MSVAEKTTITAEGCPSWKCYEALDYFFTPLDKAGCYSDRDQAYFEIKPISSESSGESAHLHMLLLQRIWVPPERRGQGNASHVIEIILRAAQPYGVAIFAVSNPFKLSNRGRTAADHQRIFLNGEGFVYPETYKLQQKKQRERFLESGFKNYQNDYTRRRNKQNRRISKKDWFVFCPDGVAEPYYTEIKRTLFLPRKENVKQNE